MIANNRLDKKHKNIRRLGNKYYVRIRCDKKEYIKSYSFKLWGSPQKALNAAVSYRDQFKCVLRFIKEHGLTIKDY